MIFTSRVVDAWCIREIQICRLVSSFSRSWCILSLLNPYCMVGCYEYSCFVLCEGKGAFSRSIFYIIESFFTDSD